MKKSLALAMVLGVLGSIVAGCGKTDDAAAPATTAATTGTAASTDTTKTP